MFEPPCVVPAAVLLAAAFAACSGSGGTANTAPSAAPDLFTVSCQVGSNYIDFQTASQTYIPAPGYGQFTVGANLGQFSSLGITTGETGQIQSLNEGTGNLTPSIPSFITFNGAGSQYTLTATYIPAGQTAGPFTLVDNGNGTSTATFEVEGNIDNNGSASGNGFDIFFSATFPFPAATLFTNLPQDTTCIATSGTVVSLSHGSRPLSRH